MVDPSLLGPLCMNWIGPTHSLLTPMNSEAMEMRVAGENEFCDSHGSDKTETCIVE